jgi:hypothetical protein
MGEEREVPEVKRKGDMARRCRDGTRPHPCHLLSEDRRDIPDGGWLEEAAVVACLGG